MSFVNFIELFVSLAIFLFGMRTLSDGLKSLAGNKMRKALEKTSNNRVTGVATGAAVTVAAQSSTIVIVTIVALVNAGVMTFIQAAHLILGANIGTTFTAFLVAFNNLPVTTYLQIAGIIGIIFMFTKNDTLKKTGVVLIGLTIVLIALGMISDAVRPLRDSEGFRNIFSYGNPLLLLLIGAVFTAIVNSSTAVNAIVVSMVAMGTMSLEAALFVTLGTNIGTTTTAIIASMGATVAAKRAAMFHFLYNVITATGIWLIALLIIDTSIVIDFLGRLPVPSGALAGIQDPEEILNIQNGFYLAWFNTFKNVISMLIVLPFVKQLVRLIEKMVPEKGKNSVSKNVEFIDPLATGIPSVAISLAVNEISRTTKLANDSYEGIMDALLSDEDIPVSKLMKKKTLGKGVNVEITNFLIEISSKNLRQKEEKYVAHLMHIVSDVHRLFSHVGNITEFAAQIKESGLTFSDEAKEEILKLHESVSKMFEISHDIFYNKKNQKLPKIHALEESVDEMRNQFIDQHIARLNKGKCTGEKGMIFSGILSNLERIADHLVSISEKSNTRYVANIKKDPLTKTNIPTKAKVKTKTKDKNKDNPKEKSKVQ